MVHCKGTRLLLALFIFNSMSREGHRALAKMLDFAVWPSHYLVARSREPSAR